MDDGNGKKQRDNTVIEEKNTKRHRSRPRENEIGLQGKEIGMKNYLEKGKIAGYEIEFGSRKRMEYSAVETRSKMAEKEELMLTTNGEVATRRYKKVTQDDAISDMHNEVTLNKVRDENSVGNRKRDGIQTWLHTQTEDGSTHIRETRMEGRGGTLMTNSTEAIVDEDVNNMETRVAAAGTCGDQEQRSSATAGHAELKEWMNGSMRELINRFDRMYIEKHALSEEVSRLESQLKKNNQVIRNLRSEIKELRIQAECERARIIVLEKSVEELSVGDRGREGAAGRDEYSVCSSVSVEDHNNNSRENRFEKGSNESENDSTDRVKYNEFRENLASKNKAGRGADLRQNRSRSRSPAKGNEDRLGEVIRCSMPDALSDYEIEWEMNERKIRKKNLIIRGIRTVGRGIKEEIKEDHMGKHGTFNFYRKDEGAGEGHAIRARIVRKQDRDYEEKKEY